ncbi:MAG: hypothetical protein AB203_04125 [Parcubacteria bacterium C7867-008]|nr:MAG: hypothetical protein AB203_04125 [Parcubacteria bacterium C7867-008]
MKNLLIGIALVVLIGVGAFVYRSAMERPKVALPIGGEKACTLEAKICPDGSGVGRTGPNCEFAACALPNAEDAQIGISFVIPDGFVANPDAIGADTSLRAVFDSKTIKSGGVPDSLIIRRYGVPAGKTGNDVILANTVHESSGIQAASMKEFEPVIINGNTFQTITVERFEALVHTEYYLVRTNDVLRFEVVEREVNNWTDPNLKVMKLPSHQALQNLLVTLQSTK